MREAGFQNIVALASSDAFGTPELTAGFSHYFGGVFLEQHRQLILEEQWATEAELTIMQDALLAWGRIPMPSMPAALRGRGLEVEPTA